MKQITTAKGNFGFVEIPNNIYEVINGQSYPHFYIKETMGRHELVVVYGKKGTLDLFIDLPKDEYGEVICTTKEATEEEAKFVVEGFEQKLGWRFDEDKPLSESIILYQNYKYNNQFLLSTATDSLQSLLEANGLDTSKNYVVLQLLEPLERDIMDFLDMNADDIRSIEQNNE